MSSGSKTSNDPNAWLGLLKWSLAYTDGTTDSSHHQPMSAEDKAFLEQVMKEGIINEGERMKEILTQVTEQLTDWTTRKVYTVEQEETTAKLLQELRDIVEQIDYARAFMAMSGLPFLLGCIQQVDHVPGSTRILCLGVLSTMCQNNPPVQQQLLELGSLRIFSELFMNADELTQTRILQAMSANVRSHEMAEQVFCELEQAVPLMEMAVNTTFPALLQRTLFFLRALVTSDAATRDRVRKFNACICRVADRLIASKQQKDDLDVPSIEMILELLLELLRQKRSVNAVLSRKEALAGTGVQRVAELRKLTGEEQEFAAVELEHWENLIGLLARAVPDIEEVPPALENGNLEDPSALTSQ